MSILDIFKGAGAKTPEAAQAATPAASTQPASATSTTQNHTETASPLDAFKELWQPDANAKGDEPIFNVDSAKVMEAAGKANFASGLSPELVQNALKGDANAFMQAINMVGQQSFAQATIASTKLIEQALEKHGASQAEKLPGLVKRSMVSDSLQSNPLYQHEATRPLMSALESQLAAKHPNATAAEITQHAQSFIAEFAKVAAGKPQVSAAEAAKAAQDDWSTFA